ncbi:hypothetical protein FGO68_gene133 [Halteria grandinella]|uniref:Uncharacterized protein n=1 Tax=Halteria grandinella TaxID=5974 RepID=A0A8J8P6V5_HALGN|nr:hypothetical protein FGO68_gene133 [Halteria grandinella]
MRIRLILILLLFQRAWSAATSECQIGTYQVAPIQSHTYDFRSIVDNWGQVYLGFEWSITHYLGPITLVKNYQQFSMYNHRYLYVVAWSDYVGQQFLSATLRNRNLGTLLALGANYDKYWQVSSTGKGNFPYYPDGSSQAAKDLVQTSISTINQGQNPSKGWVSPYVNTGAIGNNEPGVVTNDYNTWYSSNGQPATTIGANHQEFLIYRLKISSITYESCLNCEQDYYCPGGPSQPIKCPDDYGTQGFQSSSLEQCNVRTKYSYLNLLQKSIGEGLRNMPKAGSTIFISPSLNQTQVKANYIAQILKTNCSSGDSSNSINIPNVSLGKTILWKFENLNNCKNIQIETDILLDGLYARINDDNIYETCVYAGEVQEIHQRFLLNNTKPAEFVKNCLSFNYSSSGIGLNYSISDQGSHGLAKGDVFTQNNPYTKVHTTDYNDLIFVQKVSEFIPLFYLGKGNDSIVCTTSCNVYGGEGNDVFALNGEGIKMQIHDFNASEDFIDLSLYQKDIKIWEHLRYSIENPTASTYLLRLTLQQTSEMILNFGNMRPNVTLMNFIFNSTNCYRVCPNCTQDECANCQDCKICNTINCTECASTLYLEEGRCVEECRDSYLPHPEPEIMQCIYCDLKNCVGCAVQNICLNCVEDFIPVRGVCQACPLTTYAAIGDTKCKPCGTLCNKCNASNCRQCKRGTLLAPSLSRANCFLNPAENHVSTAAAIQGTFSQKQLLHGQIISQDGSIKNIDSAPQPFNREEALSVAQLSKIYDDLSANEKDPFQKSRQE